MAVARVPYTMDGRIRGTLVITDDCVFIESDNDGRELVVFPQNDELRWDPGRRQVILSWQDEEVSAASGDHVTLGGGDIPGPAQDEMLASLEWVAPPRAGCMTPVLFFSNGEIIPS